MKLENQVSNLELSKRLKELGVKQESLFYWYRMSRGMFALGDASDVMNNGEQINKTTAPQWEEYSAFTVAELGEMLPEFIWDKSEKDKRKSIKKYFMSFVSDDDNIKKVVYKSNNDDGMDDGWIVCDDENAHTEADARVKMIIYLIENKLITI